MCTVTYFPYEDGCILTSNRDEHISRKSSSLPDVEKNGEMELLFPMDNEAFGSWIMASNRGRLLCLLNGAFERHERNTPYRKSRGIVVKESFQYDSFEEFCNEYNLENIEPFTLIWVELTEATQLHELRWDGSIKHTKTMESNEKHIWSSSTLYNSGQRSLRDKWFKEWFGEDTKFDSIKTLDFHGSAGESDLTTDLKMQRENGMQTVSTTQVVITNKIIRMFHHNYDAEIVGSKQISYQQPNTHSFPQMELN